MFSFIVKKLNPHKIKCSVLSMERLDLSLFLKSPTAWSNGWSVAMVTIWITWTWLLGHGWSLDWVAWVVITVYWLHTCWCWDWFFGPIVVGWFSICTLNEETTLIESSSWSCSPFVLISPSTMYFIASNILARLTSSKFSSPTIFSSNSISRTSSTMTYALSYTLYSLLEWTIHVRNLHQPYSQTCLIEWLSWEYSIHSPCGVFFNI